MSGEVPEINPSYFDGGSPQSQVDPGNTGREILHELKNMGTRLDLLSDLTNRFMTAEEVKTEYVSKGESRKRLTAVILIILMSVIGSNLVTFGLVSKCFLTGDSLRGPSACKIIPGYSAQETRNQQLTNQFHQLLQKMDQVQQELAAKKQTGP